MMNQIKITSINITELKGLKNLNISFDKPLTAIMGVNGSGKSTIIHALACCFSPETDWGENWKFSYFFTPNPNASWKNSRFTIDFDITKQNETKHDIKLYHKDSDRWAPRYANRPIRDTIYLGIDSCLPEIEILSSTSRITYSTNSLKDKISQKILTDASIILNKDYAELTSNKTSTRSLIGVKTNNNLAYSSLSMGSGEQRVFKILKAVHTAPAYAMILIDEIDLLLHPSALRKLITILSERAKTKHLQIIFTTHSLLMNNLNDFVDIRFLEATPQKTLVYNYMSSDSIYLMTEKVTRPIQIYVEDSLSCAIIKLISLSLNLKSKIEIQQYGSIENAFTLAAGMILKNEDTQNVLIVLDGDKYQNRNEKLKQIKKVLSGTEMDIDEKQNAALDIITQYALPFPQSSPEFNIYSMLCSLPSSPEENEIIKAARRINAVRDSHNWINSITRQIDDSSDIITHEVLKLISTSPQWSSYIEPIITWLSDRSNL